MHSSHYDLIIFYKHCPWISYVVTMQKHIVQQGVPPLPPRAWVLRVPPGKKLWKKYVDQNHL